MRGGAGSLGTQRTVHPDTSSKNTQLFLNEKMLFSSEYSSQYKILTYSIIIFVVFSKEFTVFIRTQHTVQKSNDAMYFVQ